MESDTVPSEHQEEEEYVLLDLDSVYSQLHIPPNAPYVLSGLDTIQPVLILDDKFKLIGQWDETIGTCLLFKEEVASPVVHEETGPSEANLFAGKCIVDQNQSPSKQVNPLGRAYRILKFRLAPDFDSPSIVSAQTQQMHVTTGRYHTLLISNSSVYSCGSSLCGVLGQGPEAKQCVTFTRISFPSPAHVIQVSASHNHAAFVMQSGEVFTCGDNSSFCCGHKDTNRPIFRPRLVEAMKGVPCKQAVAGLNFTAFLTRQGHVYTCGANTHGQLGHGDTADSPTPKIIKLLKQIGSIVQIAAGPSYVLAVTDNGVIYSFGSGSNFCLGHGEQHDEFQPRAIQSFRRKGIHVVRVSAGDEHAVALDSSGFVYTWGKGYCGALGHGDEIEKTTPELLSRVKSQLAVQVCARKRKTFVLMDNGLVYGCGWMGFGSLGFTDRGLSDKILSPRILDSLRPHHVSQISTGLYHTVAVTNSGQLFGFGDNERAQLGHDTLRGCLKPTEILLQEMTDEADLVPESL